MQQVIAGRDGQPSGAIASIGTKHRAANGLATVWWMTAAFCVALTLASLVLALLGSNPRGTVTALRVTARFSFLLFWLAYAGGALAKLFGRAFRAVAKRGRDFGLAFASAHLVHVGLLVWLYRISTKFPFSEFTLVFFGIALGCTYLLALFSIRRLSEAIGPTCWRILRTMSLEYIALAFSMDFVIGPILTGTFQSGAKHVLEYLPFTALATLGPLLRITAWSRGLAIVRRAIP